MVAEMGAGVRSQAMPMAHLLQKAPEELARDLQGYQSRFGPWESHRARPLQEEKDYNLKQTT